MKKWFFKLLPVFLLCIVCIASVIIGQFYFNFIAQRIYEDSANHLEEIYGQVNRSFGSFVKRNWGMLDNWDGYIELNGGDKSEKINDYIKKEQEFWGFSGFYFISSDKSAMSLDGAKASMENLGEEWNLLIDNGQKIMAGYKMPDGQDVTAFVIPVAHKEYMDFGYDAIAITYNNQDMSKSLNVDAFSGKAKCFVIHNNGTVLLSTQKGGNIFSNYLVYLKAKSGLNETEIAKLQNDWKNGTSGLLQCDIAGVDSFILYQSVGYQDYILLSVVPQSVLSAGFLSVQRVTMNVLLIIFLLIGVMAFTVILVRNRMQYRRNKTELQYRERMFDVLSSTVEDIFIMLDSENQHVDYISPNVERLLGIPVGEVQSNIKSLAKCAVDYNIIVPKNELSEIPLNGNKFWECEYMHQNTGERRWYRVTIYSMSIRDVKKYIVVMSDRTVEQQMNHQLQEALDAARSANEAKSNFLSNMSHDIRTPMNAIVGFSILLEKDADRPEKVREYTRKITASSHHLLSLINDVLDMSKIESGKTSLNIDRFSLPELLEELNIIIMPQAKAKSQNFEIHVNGAPPEQILGDKLRLNQILLNLLSNAVKYTQEGGNIDFSISELPSSAPQYTNLRFVVKDNGIGMSEEFQKIIFNPFSREISSVTNTVQGTGLGMAITKNLVDLMGGIIHLESAPGKGSAFTLEISLALPEPEQNEMVSRSKVTRILVADDEEDICLNIKELMRDTGVDVSIATSGAAAVEAAVRAHNDSQSFHVILLDWKMPGMDGVETARKIREQVGDDVPILVLTSYDWSDIETEAREAGINAFMPKPFFVSTFWQTIEPLFACEDTEKERPAETDAKVMEGRMFLVAEDNEMNAEILTEMLRMEGANCELAENGEKAVEMFEKSEPGRYDMIFMDVQMPVMNGYEATKKIRASSHPEAKTIPIAAMTANTFSEDVRNALDSGMDAHLAKPIDMEAVKEIVRELLKKSDDTDSQDTDGGKEQ